MIPGKSGIGGGDGPPIPSKSGIGGGDGPPFVGVYVIRHWEVTARVQKGFLSFFSSFLDFCLLFLIFLLTWASMFGLLGASVEVSTEVLRVRAST
jgi:hypothetical protein